MRVRAVICAVFVLLLASCGDDDGEGAADTTTSTTSADTTTTTAVTTTTETTVDEGDPDACPDAAPIPDAATDAQVSAVDYDGDGDGEADTLSVFLHEDMWWVHAEWAAGGTSAVTIDEAGSMGARPTGGYDVDGDGSDEAFVSIAGPASGSIVAMYRTDGCAITPVIDADSGLGFAFPVTASIGTFSGASCNGLADIEIYTGELADADAGEYLVSAAPYTLDTDGEMNAEFGDAGSISSEELGDYSGLDCGTLSAGL